MQSRSESRARRGVAAAVTSWCVVACLPAARGADPVASRPAPAAARSRTIVDHAVMPAGGMHCRHCGTAACRVHGGHLAGCRDGMCHPHCPVRPSEYGFYHTQWRRWPGAGVVPASAEDAATPVAPPASQVPTVEEESPTAGDGAPAQGDGAPARGDGAPARGDGAPARGDKPAGSAPEDMPAAPDRPVQDEALPGDPLSERPPRAEPPMPPTPPGDAPVPPAKGAAEGDLFDQSALPIPEVESPLESGAMRYPAPVGRSLAAGIPPWRLLPQGGQRAAASARGR